MKKFIKNNILGFILGSIIFGSIGVLAASQILASDISYRDGTVESALNDLYTKANSTGYACILTSGTANQVGAKYACELGDGVGRNFYILKVNTNDVEMIMERNITDTVGSNTTMTWSDATSFFDENHPGYNLKQTWLTKVKEVKLPDAQTIANAGGITGFDATTATAANWSYFGVNSTSDTSTRSVYAWLYNYTRECENYGCNTNLDSSSGYWTKSLLQNDSSRAWNVVATGNLNYYELSNNSNVGVRPVIVLSKSQLAG